MENENNLAVAILAASRCAAIGKTAPADYVLSYFEIADAFEAFLQARTNAAREKFLAGLTLTDDDIRHAALVAALAATNPDDVRF